MADIALVSLALDSTAVVAGEKQATRALQSVDSAMQRTEKQSAQLNTSLNANVKKSGDAFKTLGESASRAGSALQGLGGPVGSLANQIGGTVSQIQGMAGAFGLVGGVAITAAAGIATLASAFATLVIDGSKVSDQMLDIAETTNLSLDTVQRFAAGMAIAGESPDALTQAFKQYQSAVVEAQDSTTSAARAFKVIGVDAKAAGQDIVGSFINSAQQIKEFRGSVAGAEATNIIYGKTAGVIARSQDAVTLALTGSRQELQDRLIIATLQAVEAGGKLDTQINKTSNAWSVFKQNLGGTNAGGLVDDFFSGLEKSLIGVSKWLKEIEKSPVWHDLFRRVALPGGIFSTGGPVTPFSTAPITGPKRSLGVQPEQKIKAGDLLGLTGGGGATKAAKGISLPFAPFTFDQALQSLGKGMKEAEERAQGLANGVAAMNARFLEILGGQVGNIMRGTPLALPGGLIQQGGPGQPFPGAPIFGGLPPPSTIRTEEQARIDEQFSLIFDDMLISILTAQKTLGEAFGELALGIVDTFAVEMAKALRESFVTPVIQGLTDMLQSALKDLFGGLSAGGLKGVFGGIAKGIGTIFGGFFASGGSLGPGKFGIAGERGPELIFSGSQPMHIAPVTAGSAGNVFNISVGVNAPSGTVDKRTQDQLAVTVMNAVKRAQRNEGAR
jgi:hypothetical protein